MDDFKKYSKDHNISSTFYEDYFKKMQRKNMSYIDPYSTGSIDIFSKLLDDRIIFLSTDVDDYVCNIIKAQMLYLETESNEDIKLYLDTGGGSIYSGLGLLDVMDYVKPDIMTVNTGLAASMGAVILCSGTKGKRKALKRSRTMIHQPLSYGNYVQQATDIEIEAREINELKRELYEIISERSGQTYAKVCKDGERDYWMNAKDTLNYGIIDEIIKDQKK